MAIDTDEFICTKSIRVIAVGPSLSLRTNCSIRLTSLSACKVESALNSSPVQSDNLVTHFLLVLRKQKKT